MGRDDLVADLKLSMNDSASVFKAADDADFVRFLDNALADMAHKRPRTKLATLTLAQFQSTYALAGYTDFIDYKTHIWGEGRQVPRYWEPGYPGALPRIAAMWDGTLWSLVLDPAPTCVQIQVLGSAFKLWYFARHSIAADAADTTVAPADRALLLLRAQAEAMRELALRNMHKPVQLRDGFSGVARNSTPPALYETLLKIFRESR
ncbi:MAG TPA: hypothetical protein VGE70_06125 [Burkholderiaceae bacterium]